MPQSTSGRDNGWVVNTLQPYLAPMQNAATDYSSQFQKLGMTLTPDRILGTAMQESGGATPSPSTVIASDGGLGLMQLTPSNGKFDPAVANELGWDNNASVKDNQDNSNWKNPINNVNAGVIVMLDKATKISNKYPEDWNNMSQQKWDATMYAYNHGENEAYKRIDADQDGSYSNITSDSYVNTINGNMDYLDQNSPFPSPGPNSPTGY